MGATPRSPATWLVVTWRSAMAPKHKRYARPGALLEEPSWCSPEPACELEHALQAEVPLATFDLADVGPMKLRGASERLLGEASLLAHLADAAAEGRQLRILGCLGHRRMTPRQRRSIQRLSV